MFIRVRNTQRRTYVHLLRILTKAPPVPASSVLAVQDDRKLGVDYQLMNPLPLNPADLFFRALEERKAKDLIETCFQSKNRGCEPLLVKCSSYMGKLCQYRTEGFESSRG